MSVVSALPLTAGVAILALALGAALGMALTPRLAERKLRRAVEQDGITISQMLQRIVSLSPMGIVVVDIYRDVVYSNDRAREFGLVRDRLLDEKGVRRFVNIYVGDEDTRFLGGLKALAA